MPAHDGAAEGAGRSETCGASASPAALRRTGVPRCEGAGVGAVAGARGTGARRSERCLDGGRRRGRRVLPHAYTQWASWISRGYLRRSLVYPPMPRRVSAVSALPGVRTRRIRVSTDRWPHAGQREAMRGGCRAPRYRRGCAKFAPRLLRLRGECVRLEWSHEMLQHYYSRPFSGIHSPALICHIYIIWYRH